MSENERDALKALREGQDKHTYFLLAAAGGAIGLAVNQTLGSTLAWSQLPLGAAVTCWALSFFFGCLHVQYVNATLYSNVDLIRIESGEHPEVGDDRQMISAASTGLVRAMNFNAQRANVLGHLQFFSLLAGAILYISWHVLGMYLRTLK